MGHFIETHWTQVAWVPAAISQLRRITVPILLIYGEDDDIIPYEQGETIKSYRVDCEVRVFEGVGHTPMHAPHVEALCSILTKWFRSPSTERRLNNQIPADVGLFWSTFNVNDTRDRLKELFNEDPILAWCLNTKP